MSELHLEEMADQNAALIEELLGREYRESSCHDVLDPRMVIEANYALADVVYGPAIARKVNNGDIETLNALYRNNLYDLLRGAETSGVDHATIGLVVVRPEIVALSDKVAEFLRAKGLHPVFSKTCTIDFKQYWGMYHHGLIHPDSRHDFPTRTFNYVNRPLGVFVVTAVDSVLQGRTVCEYLHTLKGRQGVRTANTLRGDVALRPLEAHLIEGRPDRFKTAIGAIALDPIGSYRHLVRGLIPSDDMHNEVDIPLLFYAGQAVHAPNDEEVLRDLAILCTNDEIDGIIDRVNSYRKNKDE